MRPVVLFFIAAGALATGCRGFDDGDLTEAPDGSHCGGEEPGWCDETCVDLATDALHCGACGTACGVFSHTKAAVCVAGACAVGPCDDGYADCDGDAGNGCEAPLATSKTDCGACGTVCATSCRDGACDDPIEVSAGADYTCAIRASGSLWCWGDNGAGNAGGPDQVVPAPRRVKLPGRALALATGKSVFPNPPARPTHTCAAVEGGGVLCWGANGRGQLGTGSKMSSSSPLPVSWIGPLPVVTALAAGSLHTCALTENGQVFCWGANGAGQLGLGDGVPDQVLPKPVLTDADMLAAGSAHTCAHRNGGVSCWGANDRGQLGLGDTVTAWEPATIPGLSGHVFELALGSAHSCVRISQHVSCWGRGAEGQLGLGTLDDATTPQASEVVPQGSLFVGFDTSSVRVGDTALWGWGANGSGQLGAGLPDPVVAPAQTDLGPAVRVAFGLHHACAIRPGGHLACWGDNSFGQLGTGTTDPSEEPVNVAFPEEP